jgi:general secretion pathway protein B
MSYILEALARSHFSRPPETGARALSERALLKKVGIGALLAIVILLGMAYVDSVRNDRAKAPPAAVVLQAQAVPTAPDIPSMAPRPARPASATATASLATPTPASTVRATAPAAAARFSPPVALSAPLPGPSPLGPGGRFTAIRSLAAGGVDVPPAAREPPRAAALAEVKSLSALPPDVRATIGQMKVQVLFYAPQPRSRFVMIDGRELREGDALFDGVRLEEITENGLVLKHKDMLALWPPPGGQ